MLLQFNLHYRTEYGEQIGIEYVSENNKETRIQLLETSDGQNWSATLDLKDKSGISYIYILFKDGEIVLKEWGKKRVVKSEKTGQLYLQDKWRPRAREMNSFLSTAFTESIFRRTKVSLTPKKVTTPKNSITFCLRSATIQPHLKFGIIGNISELGSWINPVWMDDQDFPVWKLTLPFKGTVLHLEYKYVVLDPVDNSIKIWEEGDNRAYHFVFQRPSENHLIITDENFNYNNMGWRGAGVAIPVFSLRSHQGFGIGEFSDLKMLTDWTSDIGMNVIQILPVNDTIANKTWQDSYPYAAISVFALHPLYLNIQNIAVFKDKSHLQAFKKTQKELNQLESVDFEKVLTYKFKYLRILFDQEYSQFKSDHNAIEFIETNKDWLKPYTSFCYLRDKYGTCNFNLWPQYAEWHPEIISTLCADTFSDIRDIEFYYFVQYHADKQLTEAKEYSRSKSIVLKGDLPIGIYRYSCDAWVAPSLYNMNEQAGAPPDDYAVLGQNWGFPTYNWSVMAQDGFSWWRKRMQMLNRYFDALRIDHILGFFRIWQIPTDQVEGTMGSFNPKLPVSKEELALCGITGDLSRYTQPFITQPLLKQMFGNDLEDVFDIFFNWGNDGRAYFKPSFDTQQKIANFVAQNTQFSRYEKSLFKLISEVLLLVEPDKQGQFFNPRITLASTYSFSQLDDLTKNLFTKLHNDYFYQRHDEYWRQQALWKLPAILDASDMLICGEDLGMIPNAVPGVMKEMNIITLEIQRMPKGNSKFGQVSSYPYFSVCSPSCHDMSTIRGWWEGDHENAKEYYYNYLHWHGLTPMQCTQELVEAIIEDHLASPSMLAIFPMQDLIGMDSNLRKKEAFSEQINEPSNPKHYWKFRFHVPLEDLLTTTAINTKIKSMVKKAGR